MTQSYHLFYLKKKYFVHNKPEPSILLLMNQNQEWKTVTTIIPRRVRRCTTSHLDLVAGEEEKSTARGIHLCGRRRLPRPRRVGEKTWNLWSEHIKGSKIIRFLLICLKQFKSWLITIWRGSRPCFLSKPISVYCMRKDVDISAWFVCNTSKPNYLTRRSHRVKFHVTFYFIIC